jgi:hypothetical protein
MRHRLFYCVAILLCYILISITAQSQLQKLYLNPKAPGIEKQSKIIDSIRFIPLEVRDNIELGAYYNISVSEKYLLLVDYLNKSLLLYSLDGKFVKKIDYKKLGANFYPGYEEATNQIVFFGNNKNYDLTAKDRIKIKLNWNNPRNKKYFKKYRIDLNDPSLTLKKDVPNERDILQVYHYYDDYYMEGQIATSPLYKDSVGYEFKMYKNNQLVKRLFPYNRINEPRFLYTSESVSLNKTDTPYINFITRPYCDTIYKLIKDSIYPAYQLVLPLENTLPPSFFITPFKNKTDRDNFNRNNGWMLRQVYNFYETPGFIYFLVSYLSNFDSYVYQKQTKAIYKSKNIKADSSQYNLQLLGDQRVARRGDKFYRAQKAGDLLAFFDKNKNVPVPKELEPFLKSKPDNTAPVIVEFKFKN